ncbi:MAG: gamma-glutamylcyclotransferase [Candidatus Fermentibacteraceae bacterium]|nr:gamma-glutamylcyclotransferase [Candidatus Fermentibacteraceae bacterium]
MLYFSFGSNMSEKRLLQRIKAEKIGVAVLNGHRLRFHKPSILDGSAKCDIQETGQPEDFVLGVLYDLEESQKSILDVIEGLGSGYDLKTVSVAIDGRQVKACTYYATSINPELKPYHWYKKHVLEGAIENRMPEDYIKSIEAVESVTDKDDERRQRELSIYQR